MIKVTLCPSCFHLCLKEKLSNQELEILKSGDCLKNLNFIPYRNSQGGRRLKKVCRICGKLFIPIGAKTKVCRLCWVKSRRAAHLKTRKNGKYKNANRHKTGINNNKDNNEEILNGEKGKPKTEAIINNILTHRKKLFDEGCDSGGDNEAKNC